MLSQLTNYLFGAENNEQQVEAGGQSAAGGRARERFVEEDWVLVQSQDGTSTPSSGRRSNSVDLNESWMVMADLPVMLAQHNRRRQEGRPPKGTKPRRNRRGQNRKNNDDIEIEDIDMSSLDSSIAVVPGPETRAAAAALLQAAALADAKQMAAISAARMARRVEVKHFTRSCMERANKIISAQNGGGGKGRRRHLVPTRFCGSNNNRKC